MLTWDIKTLLSSRRREGTKERREQEKEKEKRDQRVKALLSQIQYLHNEEISIQNSFLAMIYIPIAFLGVLIYYSYSTGKPQLFLLLPFLFCWCISNLMKYTMKILGIDAYIRYMEEELNQIYGEELFLWQSQLVYANGYSIWGVLGQAPCFLAVCAFLSYKFFQTLGEIVTDPWICWGLVAIFILQAGVLIIMAVYTGMHYHKVKAKIAVMTHTRGQDGGGAD